VFFLDDERTFIFVEQKICGIGPTSSFSKQFNLHRGCRKKKTITRFTIDFVLSPPFGLAIRQWFRNANDN
jgi:hypothetical protein